MAVNKSTNPEEERKRKEDEDRKKAEAAKAQADVEAAKAQQTAQAAQAAAPASTYAAAGSKPDVAPAKAAPKTEEEPEQTAAPAVPTTGYTRGVMPKLNKDQHFQVGQAKADRETASKVVQAGELDMLPENLQDRKEEFEQKNAEGRLGNTAMKQWSSKGNEIDVEVSSIKNVNQLAYFATTLADDEQRRNLYKAYADMHGLKLDDLFWQAETLLGDRAFDYPQSNRGRMEYIGLYDIEGNKLDFDTANQAQVLQAIRMTPPGDEHDALVKAYQYYYGDFSKNTNFDFIESADLTKSEYNAAIKEFDSSFSFSNGHTEDSQQAYLDLVDDIYAKYSSPRVQKQMLFQLQKSYAAHTGVEAPSIDEINALMGQEALDEEGNRMSFTERAKTMWEGITNLFSSKGKAKGPMPEIMEDATLVASASGGIPAKGDRVSYGGGGGAASSYAAAGSATPSPVYQMAEAQAQAEEAAMQGAAAAAEVQGPQYIPQESEQQASAEPEAAVAATPRELGEVQGPEYRPQEAASNADRYAKRIAYNAQMSDEEALSRWRKGETLDERNMAQIGWITQNRNVQALFNGMGMYGDLGSSESGRGVIDKFSYFGNSIGAASMVVNNGSLPEDAAASATLALGRVVDQIDQIVADPSSGITVPKGQNMYEYVLSLPQYEGLYNQVQGVLGAQAQVNEAYAAQALAEEEARQRQLESDRAAILAGNGTPEMAARLAAANGSEYIDVSDDELRAMWRFQMGNRSSFFFPDDGTFWNSGSAAAVEGTNLRKMGGYADYKVSLKRETENLIDEYTVAAKRMGMTLEEYLTSAGISELGQMIDIAYSGMIEKGNAYAADKEAQEAATEIATTSVGMVEAGLLGAQHGVESYAADFMQTAYMVVDAADYSTAVLDLQNQYRMQYGDEQAAAMYYADLMAYIDSGALSEESANDLLDHMARARSIFDVGYEIDPGFLEGLMRDSREGLQKDVEALETMAQALPENERWFFKGVSGITHSLTGMAVSTVTGGLAGSAAVGSALAWGTTEYSSAYDANRAKGMSPGMSAFMALGNAGLSAAAQMSGTGSQMELWFSPGSTYRTFMTAMQSKGGIGLLKSIGAQVAKQAHQEGMEEVSETILGAAYDLLDKEALALDSGAPMSMSRFFTNLMDSVEETDVEALGREILTSYGMGAAYGGIFSLAGVGKTALAARKGINAQTRYSSIDLATQMSEGTVPFTEENIGKLYAAAQKDLTDPRFRKWIDSGHMAAVDQNATVTAMMMGAGSEQRKAAVAEAQKAQDYEQKAEAARSASQTAQGRWWELRDRLSGGDMSAEVELESARMQWQKAETALAEAETAAVKSKEKALELTRAWLKESRMQSGTVKSWMLKQHADRIAMTRMETAEALAQRYLEQDALTRGLVHDYAEGANEALETRYVAEGAIRQRAENVAGADDAKAYAESRVFEEESAADNEAAEDDGVSTMTDDELDAAYTELVPQIAEAERNIADVTSRSEELGLTGETIQAMVAQEVAPLSQRREKITAEEKRRFDDLFNRMQQALEMDDEAAADALQEQYDSARNRLDALGFDTESMILAQYGFTAEEVAASEEDQKTAAADEEIDKLTDSLTRRMEETAAQAETIKPARGYFMKTPIYVNPSQAADILSMEGLKSISQFNRRYGTKLTTDEGKGAMPLDGHVLSDIDAEAAGAVNADGDPVAEMLGIMQRGKEIAARQTQEKAEARELREKRKAAKQRRRSSVDALVSAGRAQAVAAENSAEATTQSTAKQENGATDTTGSIDALAGGTAPTTPAQAQQKVSNARKKLESNALRAVQELADSINVGLRIKSDARFQSKGARMGKDVLGYYKNGQRNAIVRSKEAGKLEVSGHEIGHAVQEQLGIPATQTMIDSWQKNFGNTGAYTPAQYDHEAFAEFFWRYLKGRDVAVAYTDDASVDAFEYALRGNKKMRKAVMKAQEQVSAYFAADTGARIQANIASMSEAKKNSPFIKWAQAALVDDTVAAEPLQDVIRERTGEDHLSYDLNLRDTVRYNRRSAARAEQCVSEGLVDNDGNIVGESLADVFSEIKGKDYDLYMQWWLARHSIDRDRRKGEKNQVFAESDLSTQERLKFITDTELKHPEFAKTNERFQKWRRLFMDTYLVKTGLLGDPARATAMLDMLEQIYPYYAPTKRTQKGGLGTNAARGMKGQKTYATHTATGSTETIIDPFESFVSMINSVVSLAAENDNKNKFAELYDAFSAAAPGVSGSGMGMFANEITQDMQKNVVDTKELRKKIEQMLDDIDADPDVITEIGDLIDDQRVQYRGKGRVDMDNVIRVRGEDGSDRYFEIYNPELFNLLATVSGRNESKDNGILKGIGTLTRTMSMLTTGSNPVFGITNALRDFQSSVNYGSWATSYIDGAAKWIATLIDVATGADVSKEYDALGGGGWTQFDTRTKKGAERTRSEVFKGYNRKNIGQIGKTAGRTLWRIATLEDLNAAIEKTSRLAEYKYGKHDRSTTQGRIEAFLAAQDATTDFARRGSTQWARDLRYLVPFFNASMQGVYRNARQFTAQESDRAKIRLAKQITNTALASLLANGLMLMYLDDDEKEEFTYLSEDLTAKHMFLPNFAPDVFGDAMTIRIPLDQNPLSYAINAAVSNMVWKGETGDDFLVGMAALTDVVLGTMNPVGSTILDPFVAMKSNKNWYGSNIVPTYLQSYDAANQYTEETPSAFVAFSEAFASHGIDISPMMLQYLAEQNLGYIGQTIIPALPSEKNKDRFITGVFTNLAATARKRITSDPLKSNDVVSRVYDSFNELSAVSKAGNSGRDMQIQYLNPALDRRQKTRAVDEAYDLTHSGGELYEAKKEISALYDEIDAINARENLTDRQRKLLIDDARREMIEIALDVQETMEDYNARYRYEGILPRWIARRLNQ